MMHFALVAEETAAVGEALNFDASGFRAVEGAQVFVAVFANLVSGVWIEGIEGEWGNYVHSHLR